MIPPRIIHRPRFNKKMNCGKPNPNLSCCFSSYKERGVLDLHNVTSTWNSGTMNISAELTHPKTRNPTAQLLPSPIEDPGRPGLRIHPPSADGFGRRKHLRPWPMPCAPREASSLGRSSISAEQVGTLGSRRLDV